MLWKMASGACFAFVLCVFLTFAAAPAEGQQFPANRQRITCESIDQARKQCNVGIGGDVRIFRQLSDTQCVEGRNWGWNRSGIWVDNGCRAEFEFNPFADSNRGGSGDLQSLTCESVDQARKQCNANIGSNVRLTRQLSDTQCVEGRNWGWDRNGIWVDNGCRAEFQFNTFADSRDTNRGRIGQDRQDRQDRRGSGNWQFLTCESTSPGRGRTQCKADIAGDVRLTRQLSNAQCAQGRDWGWQRNHVWVRNGCSAEFEYRQREQPGKRTGQGQNQPGKRTGQSQDRSRSQDRQTNAPINTPLETLTCESNDNNYRECRVNRNISNVRVAQRLSDSSCVQGNSWGLKSDQRTIWVNHGCRAVFEFRRT